MSAVIPTQAINKARRDILLGLDNISVPKTQFPFTAGGVVEPGDRLVLDGSNKVIPYEVPLDAGVDTLTIMPSILSNEYEVLADVLPVPGTDMYVLVFSETDLSNATIIPTDIKLATFDSLTGSFLYNATLDSSNTNSRDTSPVLNCVMHPSGDYMVMAIQGNNTADNIDLLTVGIDKINKTFTQGTVAEVASSAASPTVLSSNYKSHGLAWIPDADTFCLTYSAVPANRSFNYRSFTVTTGTLAVNLFAAATWTSSSITTNLRRHGIFPIGNSKAILYDAGYHTASNQTDDNGAIQIVDFAVPSLGNLVGSLVRLSFPYNNNTADHFQGHLYFSEESNMFYAFATINSASHVIRYNAISFNNSTNALAVAHAENFTNVEIDGFSQINTNALHSTVQLLNNGRFVLFPSENNFTYALKVESDGSLTEAAPLYFFTSQAEFLNNYYYIQKLDATNSIFIRLTADATSSQKISSGIGVYDEANNALKTLSLNASPDYIGVALSSAVLDGAVNVLLEDNLVGNVVSGFTGLTPKEDYYVDLFNNLNTNGSGRFIGTALTDTILSLPEVKSLNALTTSYVQKVANVDYIDHRIQSSTGNEEEVLLAELFVDKPHVVTDAMVDINTNVNGLFLAAIKYEVDGQELILDFRNRDGQVMINLDNADPNTTSDTHQAWYRRADLFENFGMRFRSSDNTADLQRLCTPNDNNFYFTRSFKLTAVLYNQAVALNTQVFIAPIYKLKEIL